MSKIIHSAIWFKLKDTNEYPMIFTGLLHADIYERIFKTGFKLSEISVCEGFMTQDNRFVDRYEAYDIAREEGQIISNNYWKNGGLYSEDLWPDDKPQ